MKRPANLHDYYRVVSLEFESLLVLEEARLPFQACLRGAQAPPGGLSHARRDLRGSPPPPLAAPLPAGRGLAPPVLIVGAPGGELPGSPGLTAAFDAAITCFAIATARINTMIEHEARRRPRERKRCVDTNDYIPCGCAWWAWAIALTAPTSGTSEPKQQLPMAGGQASGAACLRISDPVPLDRLPTAGRAAGGSVYMG